MGATRRSAMSAGGLVIRGVGGRPEIVIGRRRRERDGFVWALPKGRPDGNEAPEETALREVREETGLEVKIVGTIGEIEYWYTAPDGERVQKTVHYFLMEPTGGDIADHDHEFDRVEWRHLSEAERLLTHRNQLPMLHRAWEQIGKMTV